MVCPNCNSSDVKRVSLIHAAGVYESRGRIRGLVSGSGDGFLFGSYRGTSQSRLSKAMNPPRKLPYVAPVILWLVGLFPTMASVARAKLSPLTGLISVAYVLALPVYFLVALFYNWLVRPKKYKNWERKFMCQRCGALIEGHTRTQVNPRQQHSHELRGR
jgi:hypothetical protein